MNLSEYLGQELVELNREVEQQEIEIEMLRMKAAMYKAYFFRESKLARKIDDQIEENRNALIGEFDGFCYASWRALAVFRTLEDMKREGLLTEEEYGKCEII